MTATTAPTASTWWVEVFVGENDGVSTATATLHTRDRHRVSAHGSARLNPSDRDVPEIGYELATARALSALAHQLLELAADDITGVTQEQVSVPALTRDPSDEGLPAAQR